MNTATINPPQELDNPGVLENGTLAPYFSGIDQNGNFQSLDRLVKNGPFVMIFYRGHWCYFCRKHIARFQKELDKMSSGGFPVVLITPEKPKYIQETVKRTNCKFPVLHDNLTYIMKNYKVAKSAPNTLRLPFGKVNLNEVNDNEEPILPVPATYIIGKDGLIKYGHYTLNFALRSSFKTIANKVEELRSGPMMQAV